MATKGTTKTRELEQLLVAFDEAFDRKSWHGTNLRGSLRGMSAEEASRRPAPGRHNVWELVLHAAYWKYVVRRKLTGGKRASFPLAGSNFFERPAGEPTERAWKADIALLVEEHRQLRAVVAALEGARPSKESLRLVRGVIAHDNYHCGQIQLIKKLVR